MANYKIHGITEEITTCDCCGKSNLKKTVGLEIIEGDKAGDIMFFGTTCAGRAMNSGMKSSLIVDKAKAMQKVRPVIDAVKAALPLGLCEAKNAGRQAAKGVVINGADISVSGFESWGQINIDWNGGREIVPLSAS